MNQHPPFQSGHPAKIDRQAAPRANPRKKSIRPKFGQKSRFVAGLIWPKNDLPIGFQSQSACCQWPDGRIKTSPFDALSGFTLFC
jgi:hypothetical protein